jgi:ribosome-binding protein aMBF1 (putative translation factor)
LSTKGPVIGRYERDEMKPSIEAAAKMANILEVSLDYLVGKADEHLYKPTSTEYWKFKNTQQRKKTSSSI